MITSAVIALLALAMFNLFAAGLCYHNAAIKQIEENKFSFFWHLLGILNVACCGVCYQKYYWGIITIGLIKKM